MQLVSVEIKALSENLTMTNYKFKLFINTIADEMMGQQRLVSFDLTQP